MGDRALSSPPFPNGTDEEKDPWMEARVVLRTPSRHEPPRPLLASSWAWISFGKLFGGGCALYALEFLLGSLFLDRFRLGVRILKLEEFHLEIAGGKLTSEQAAARYADILGVQGSRGRTQGGNRPD